MSVFSSKREGLGMDAVESLSMGIPVAASEILQNSGRGTETTGLEKGAESRG